MLLSCGPVSRGGRLRGRPAAGVVCVAGSQGIVLISSSRRSFSCFNVRLALRVAHCRRVTTAASAAVRGVDCFASVYLRSLHRGSLRLLVAVSVEISLRHIVARGGRDGTDGVCFVVVRAGDGCVGGLKSHLERLARLVVVRSKRYTGM